MKHLLLEPDFDAWREAARQALHDGFEPREIDFADAAAPAPLLLALEPEMEPTGPTFRKPHVPAAFLEAAKAAAAHRDPAAGTCSTASFTGSRPSATCCVSRPTTTSSR